MTGVGVDSARTAAAPESPEDAGPVGLAVLRGALRARLAPVGIVVLAAAVAAGALAPVIAPYDPLRPDVQQLLAPPGLAHPFGTDDLGRDVLSRVVYGARVSMAVGLVAVALAFALGVTIGVAAGYAGGWLEGVAVRLVDALLSFPALILALAIATVLGAGLTAVMVAIAVVYVPTFARLSRGQVLVVREHEFVVAARALGVGDIRIVVRHILPAIAAPLVVQTSLSIAFAILAEASLSFLGLGMKPPQPSWGSMVSEGRQYLRSAPWTVFAPGAAIFLVVMSLNFVGDALRDALDPRSRP
jgi:peptide/nickel transport system permease protein